jgi:hypothetical protein
VWRGRGLARSLKGDNERAIADFDQALTLDPGVAGVGDSRARSVAALAAR